MQPLTMDRQVSSPHGDATPERRARSEHAGRRPRTRALLSGLILCVGVGTHDAHGQDGSEPVVEGADAREQALDRDRILLLSLPDLSRETPRELERLEPREQIERYSFGQDPTEGERTVGLALERVRAMALQNNLDIRARVLQPDIARLRVDEEGARFESIFSASLALNSREPVPSPGEPAITTEGYDATLALDVPLRTGGLVSLSLPTTFTDPDFESAPDFQTSTLNFSVSHPLLRNAGRAVNEAAIEIARVRSIQEQARTKLGIIRTLSETETSYWGLYAASEVLEIRRQQYERALELERKATRLAEVDVIPQIEVVRARSGVARRFESIILTRTERQLAERALKLLLNDPAFAVGSDVRLFTETDPTPRRFQFDREQVVRLAIANRLDLIDAQLQLDVEDLAILFADNQRLPALDLSASTQFSDRGEDLSDSLGSEFTSWQIGARFEVPLGNRASRAQLRRSLLQKDVAETNVQLQELIIRQQVLDALDRVEQSWQRILAARQEAALAAETYTAEERQFLAGERTSTDVLEAADFLAEAQVREIRALGSYEIELVNAALATGTLLGKGQIRLDLQQ